MHKFKSPASNMHGIAFFTHLKMGGISVKAHIKMSQYESPFFNLLFLDIEESIDFENLYPQVFQPKEFKNHT